MVGGLVALTITAVMGFGLILWVLYRGKLRQLRRNPVAGTVQISAKGFASLALLVGAMWAFLCGGLLLAVYAGLPSYVVSVGVVILIGLARPVVVAAGVHPFVIRPGIAGPAEPAGPFKGSQVTAAAGVRRDDAAVFAEHRAALERGEEHALRRTVTGELHSYAKDEHVAPGNDPYNLRSLWVGILIAAVYLGFAILSAALFAGQLVRGEPLNWLLPAVAVIFIIFGRPAFVFCRDEFKASKVRKERGIPKPDRGKEIKLPDLDGSGARFPRP